MDYYTNQLVAILPMIWKLHLKEIPLNLNFILQH